jgi:hypothetical protein
MMECKLKLRTACIDATHMRERGRPCDLLTFFPLHHVPDFRICLGDALGFGARLVSLSSLTHGNRASQSGRHD